MLISVIIRDSTIAEGVDLGLSSWEVHPWWQLAKLYLAFNN